MFEHWKKSYDKPRQCIKKDRHYFADKGPYNQSYVFFPVVMYGCESWTINKAEHWRFDGFNCVVGEDSCDTPWLQGDPTSPS